MSHRTVGLFQKSLLKEIGFRSKPIFKFTEPSQVANWEVLLYICTLEIQVAKFSIERSIEELKKLSLPLPLKLVLTNHFENFVELKDELLMEAKLYDKKQMAEKPSFKNNFPQKENVSKNSAKSFKQNRNSFFQKNSIKTSDNQAKKLNEQNKDKLNSYPQILFTSSLKSECITAKVTIDETQYTGIIDTGSDITLVSKKLAKNWNAISRETCNIKCKTISGEFSTDEKLKVEIIYNEKNYIIDLYTLKFLQNPQLSNKLVLGLDFINEVNYNSHLVSNINDYKEKACELRRKLLQSVTKSQKMPFECEIFTEKGKKYTEFRKMYPENLQKAKKLVTELVSKGYVESAKSDWLIPIQLVKKANGKDRFCLDLRGLNRLVFQDN